MVPTKFQNTHRNFKFVRGVCVCACVYLYRWKVEFEKLGGWQNFYIHIEH